MAPIIPDQRPAVTPHPVREQPASSCPRTIMRQTHLCQNDKTVIRLPTDVHAKLCEQNSADGFGGALHFAPDPVKIERHRCHSILGMVVLVSHRPTIINVCPSASDGYPQRPSLVVGRTLLSGTTSWSGRQHWNAGPTSHAKRGISTQR